MELSVIVPVYNVEPYLRECVESLLGQEEFTEFELILVDDGSTDGSGAVCDEYAQKDSRIRVVHTPNGGLSAARNKGLELAEGKYITFIDSDDLVSPDYIARAMRVFELKPHMDLVEMPVIQRHGSPTSELYEPLPHEETEGTENIFALWVKHEGWLHTYAWNKFYKRDLLGELRFPVGHIFEDTYLTPRYLERCRHCYRLRYIGDGMVYNNPPTDERGGVYFYRYRPGSISLTPTYQGARDYLEHQLPYLEKAADTADIDPADTAHYTTHLANIFIDLMRTDEALLPENRPFAVETLQRLSRLRPPFAVWKRLPDTPRNCLKHLPFILLGLRAHIWLYTRKWIRRKA